MVKKTVKKVAAKPAAKKTVKKTAVKKAVLKKPAKYIYSFGAGRAEFIDMDIEKLKARGIVYAIPQVNSYTGQKFSEQPHTCFGVMKRTDDEVGPQGKGT